MSSNDADSEFSSPLLVGDPCEKPIKHPNPSSDTREEILAQSWTTVAAGYEQSLVPRFASWTDDALNALRAALKDTRNDAATSCHSDDDPQKALVLCCGPGQELVPIAKLVGPDAFVLGIDLAPGMVEAAKRRVQAECRDNADSNNIAIRVGDAGSPPPGPYSVIFSAFGLQQLPKPINAIKEWIKVLQPSGIGVVMYWSPSAPPIPGEEDGPFERWSEILNKKLGKEDEDNPPWDGDIAGAAEEAGSDILEDTYIVHSMEFANPGQFFDIMSRAGPWHAMRLRRGDEFVNDLGKEFQAMYPVGEPLSNRFTARMLVLRRR
mmetsp:Transcript_12298/g.26070  ORF Transcript_12298/g.26070 Transcript_12298/m.26070 type:complete len:321 (-) Transcript_12298:216-1178(-)|eukprot:CAMPEP_0178587654 /NCGR_PEP_ID=MMETSP0697-20121206/26562_1 /TAXON_ID=265572 /ORGANISM="Extubocellulus spinifer, Strain CCMP396" /LENGTH=320 /DNA_ID=CAMNT_0020223845 /DNA_START=183 /DNA_END=1148 /DNA_ORIENTATION=-